MFYVYHGYVGPDNYDASEKPCYRLTEFQTAEEVAAAHQEFQEELPLEASNVKFEVIEGTKRHLVEKEKVTEWELV